MSTFGSFIFYRTIKRLSAISICVKVALIPSIFIIVIAEQSKEGCYDFDRSPAIISLGLLIYRLNWRRLAFNETRP